MGNRNSGQRYERQDQKGKGKKKHKSKGSERNNRPHDNSGSTRQQSAVAPNSYAPIPDNRNKQQLGMKTNTTHFENEFERLKNENAELSNSTARLAEVIAVREEALRKRDGEIASYEQNIKILEKENERSLKNLKSKDSLILSLTNDMKDVKKDRDTILTRYSALAGSKLTHGNANIADLSDENRPTKLAEKYSELYDNEWTEAFSFLTAEDRRTSEEACKIIAKAFCCIYSACRQKADCDMEDLIASMKSFYEADNIPSEILKTVKDQRKKHPNRNVDKIRKLYNDDMGKILSTEEQDSTNVSQFLLKSIDLCWLMAVQDPPVCIDTNLPRMDEIFNINLYKPYTATGKYIAFIVWPTLYLSHRGSVLCKGIAQGKKSQNGNVEKTYNTSSEDNKGSLIPFVNISKDNNGSSKVSKTDTTTKSNRNEQLPQNRQELSVAHYSHEVNGAKNEKFNKSTDDRRRVFRDKDYKNPPQTTSDAKDEHNPKSSADVPNLSISNSEAAKKTNFKTWYSAQQSGSKQGKNVTTITATKM